MSIHPSLTISEKDKKARSVLKRIERIRQMQEKGNWKQGDSVYGLPKIKSLRIKIKKEKVEKAATADSLIIFENSSFGILCEHENVARIPPSVSALIASTLSSL